MTVASRKQYSEWVVEALKHLGAASPKQVYAWVEKHCPVPAADLSGLNRDVEPLYQKEIRFARWELRQAGIIDGSKRGCWRLA